MYSEANYFGMRDIEMSIFMTLACCNGAVNFVLKIKFEQYLSEL